MDLDLFFKEQQQYDLDLRLNTTWEQKKLPLLYLVLDRFLTLRPILLWFFSGSNLLLSTWSWFWRCCSWFSSTSAWNEFEWFGFKLFLFGWRPKLILCVYVWDFKTKMGWVLIFCDSYENGVNSVVESAPTSMMWDGFGGC